MPRQRPLQAEHPQSRRLDPRCDLPARSETDPAGVPLISALDGANPSADRQFRALAWSVRRRRVLSGRDRDLPTRPSPRVLLGKTSTCEFGLSPTVEPAPLSPTRNPLGLGPVHRRLERWAGGLRTRVGAGSATTDAGGWVGCPPTARSSHRPGPTSSTSAAFPQRTTCPGCSCSSRSVAGSRPGSRPTTSRSPRPSGRGHAPWEKLVGVESDPLRGCRNASRYLMFEASWPTSPATQRCPCRSDSTSVDSPSSSTHSAGRRRGNAVRLAAQSSYKRCPGPTTGRAAEPQGAPA